MLKISRGDAICWRRRDDVLAAIALATVLVGAAAGPILTGALGQKAWDHRWFHLPLVREWARTWPAADLRDYNSATGPLYHWLMAGVAQLVGTGTAPDTAPALQFASALFGVAVVLVAYSFARRCLPPGGAFTAALVLACSPYVLGNAIWLMTDNLSLALTGGAIGSATFSTPRARPVIRQGVLAALAVATRQINLWLLTPILAATLRHGPARRGWWPSVGIAVLLPCATLATLMWLWGGPVPPRFRGVNAGKIQPTAVGYALTLVAAYGAVVAAAARQGWRAMWRHKLVAAGVLAVGATLGALGEATVSEQAGRSGGWLWTLVSVTPALLERSLVIVVGAAGGALVLAILAAEARARARGTEAAILVAAFGSFAIAHVANSQIFQRYYDPVVLLTVVWLASLGGPAPGRVIALAGLAATQAVFACVTIGDSIL